MVVSMASAGIAPRRTSAGSKLAATRPARNGGRQCT
jgi:hypothetical protein